MTIYDTLLWAVLLLMVWGVSSCSDDSEPMDEDTLELLSYSREMEEVTRTATVPAGYQLYVTQHPEVVEEGHAICAYLTWITISMAICLWGQLIIRRYLLFRIITAWVQRSIWRDWTISQIKTSV